MTSRAPANQRLSPTSLRVVLDKIAQVHVGTTLHVTDGASERIFYFVKGGVRVLSNGLRRGPGFEEHVSRSAAIDQAVLTAVMDECRKKGLDPRSTIIEKGLIPRDRMGAIISQMVRDALFELVFWRNAFYSLHTRPPPEEIHDPERGGFGGSIDNAEIARAAIRWLDDWSSLRQVLNSEQTRVSVLPRATESRSSLAPSIAGLIDACAESGKSVRDLWLTTGRPLDQLCRDLVELTEKGLIALAADRSWSRRSPTEEIEELEVSLAHLVAKDPVRERLALLYRRTKQPEKAVEQLKILARGAVAARNLDRANEHYKVILNLEPRNVEVFEILIDLNGTSKLVKDVKNFALNHLQRLANHGHYQEADHCARLLESLPGVGTEVVEFKAATLASRGKTREAAVECMRVAKLYDDRGDIALASHLYRKAAAYQNRAASENPPDKVRKAGAAGDSRRSGDSRRAQVPYRGESRAGVRLLAASLALAAAGAVFYWHSELGILREDTWSGLAGSVGASPPIASASGRGAASSEGNRSPHRQADPSTGTCDDARIFRTRSLNAAEEVTFASSCRLSIRNRGGLIIRELPGATGARWAIGREGRFVCRWKPAERPVVFGPGEREGVTLEWPVPAVADALAIGRNRIVMRASRVTVVYDFEGSQIFEAELPEWEEGVLLDDHLVLTRHEPRALWLVDADTLNLLWTCRNEPGGMVVW